MNSMQPLTIEEYAAVAARVLHGAGAPLDAILAELGIPAETWALTADLWERAIDAALARGDDELLATFVARFTATRTALARARTSEPSRSGSLAGRLTAAVDRERLSVPALPFASPLTPPPQRDSARRSSTLSGLPFAPTAAASDIADAPPTVRSPRPRQSTDAATPRSSAKATAPVVEDAGPETVRLPAPVQGAATRGATSAAMDDRSEDSGEAAPLLLLRVTHLPRRGWFARLREWLRRS